MLSTRDSLEIQKHKQIESKKIEKIFHTISTQKGAGVAILTSDKIIFKLKNC